MPDPFDRTSVVTSGFRWTTFDLTGRLPEKWQQEIAAVAAAEAEFREFPRTPSLSREAADVHTISRGRLHAGDLRHNLPWLYRLYRGISSTWPGRWSATSPLRRPATTGTASS